MEQIQELFEILKETPQMALWGLTIYVLFVLAKLASWIYALKAVVTLFINKYFENQKKKLDQSSADRILKYFDNNSMSSVEEDALITLLESIKDDGYHIFESDIRKAVKAIKESKTL